MTELLHAMAGAALWAAGFLLIVAAVNRTVGRTAADPLGLLSAYPLFFFLEVGGIKLLDLVHRLDTPSMIVLHILLALAVAGATRVLPGGLRNRRSDERADRREAGATSPTAGEESDAWLAQRVVLACGGLTVAALGLFALITPVHVWDVQAYHMPMVASYVQNESLAAWPAQDLRQVYRVNAAELQMLALASLARSDAWVELPNVIALGVCLVAVFHIARLVLRRDTLAWLTTALLLTAPQVLLGSVTAKNDIIFTALILCAFYWTLRFTVNTPDRVDAEATPTTPNLRWRLTLLGLVAGLAVATKVMGLNLLGAVGLALLALAVQRRVPLRSPFVFGAIAVAFIAVLVGDVYWQNFNRSQDVPVGTMPGEIWFTSGFSNIVAAAHFYLYDLSFSRLVRPQIIEHDFSHYGYFFPFLLVAGTIAVVRDLLRRRLSAEPVLATLALLAFALFASVIAVRQPIGWDQRFMLWMVPTFSVFALTLLRTAEPRTVLMLVSAAAAFGLVNLFQTFSNASEGLFVRSAVHLVREGELASLRDVAQPKYLYKIDGYAALDRTASPGDSVLYVGWEDTWMYPAWGRRFDRYVSGVDGPQDAAQRTATRTYRFLVVEDDASQALKDATLAAAARAGYTDLVPAEGRRIMQRSDAQDRP
jgi:hypothetical protein